MLRTVHADSDLVAMVGGQDISSESAQLISRAISAYSNNVDFPAPRYPVKRVIGIFGRSSGREGPATGSSSSSRLEVRSMYDCSNDASD
jgi:hypothetical protein